MIFCLLLLGSMSLQATERFHRTGTSFLENKKQSNESGSRKPFVVKTNFISLGFRNLSLAAEYAFHKNLTGGLGFRFMMPYDLSSFAGGGQTLKMSGYAITPEFRFYPGKKSEHLAPHGFYIGLYGRISNFSMDMDVPLDAPTVNGVAVPGISGATLNINGNLKQMGGGFIMGMQWAKKSFVFDWSLIGLGVASSFLSVTTQNDILKYSTAADQFKNTLEFADAAATLGSYKPSAEVNTTTGTATVKMAGMLPQIRSIIFGNMSIGFRF